MAQHDYVIDNSTGANVRADLNNALQAIVTNNSGSSAPSATFPFMLFADSAAGTMKIRNAADNAFIELFQLDGTFTLEDGSASSPALAFRDDLNTGIFSSADNTINFATGGVERLEMSNTSTIFNDGGNDIDFAIEGDTDANLFYLNAGNDAIGIGTNAADTPLHVFKQLSDRTARFQRISTQFIDIKQTSGINSFISTGKDFEIGTTDSQDFIFDTNGSESMRIDSSGRVGIGTTSPTNNIHIGASGADQKRSIKIDGTNGNSELQGVILESDGENAKFNIKMGIGGGTPSTKLTLLSTGGLTFNGDTAAANALDDYEEGTFTPALEGSSSNPTVNYSTRVGHYTKIGNVVYIQVLVDISSYSGGSGEWQMGGLPFTTNASAPASFDFNWNQNNKVSWDSNAKSLGIFASANNTFLRARQFGNNVNNALQLSAFSNSENLVFGVFGSYIAA